MQAIEFSVAVIAADIAPGRHGQVDPGVFMAGPGRKTRVPPGFSQYP
jgi:hypothetical protein